MESQISSQTWTLLTFMTKYNTQWHEFWVEEYIKYR